MNESAANSNPLPFREWTEESSLKPSLRTHNTHDSNNIYCSMKTIIQRDEKWKQTFWYVYANSEGGKTRKTNKKTQFSLFFTND